MSLINCEIDLITLCTNCVTSNATANQATKFAMADKELYVLVVTLSTQDNITLLQQLKSFLRKQLIGGNINQKVQQKYKINI